MSSKAAQAVYPNLAAKEPVLQKRLAEKPETSTKPEWGKSDAPWWAEPRPAPPRDYSKVPGLRRK